MFDVSAKGCFRGADMSGVCLFGSAAVNNPCDTAQE